MRHLLLVRAGDDATNSVIVHEDASLATVYGVMDENYYRYVIVTDVDSHGLGYVARRVCAAYAARVLERDAEKQRRPFVVQSH
ncbi:MAG: hypothetical protein ACEQSD_12310 [Flavobacteriales bacterium]